MYKVHIYHYFLSVGKVQTVMGVKNILNLGLKEAKDFVESLPTSIEVEDRETVERLKEWFNCDAYLKKDDEIPSNYNIREPDEATKEALAWRDSLSEKEQEMIKLIADWENPVCIAAVC